MVDTAVAKGLATREWMAQRARQGAQLLSTDQGLAVMIGVAALAIALYRLGSSSLWMDEALSVEHVRQSPDILWASFTSGYSAYMFLYFPILAAWLHLTAWLGLAPTEFIIRFPSAVFGALAAVVVFLLGRRYVSRMAGLAAALVCMLDPWQLTYSQEARSYSLLLFLCALAWYALLGALSSEQHARRWWILYVIASALATYAQILNLVMIFTQVVAFAALFVLPNPWRTRVRTRWKTLLLSLVGVAVLVAPQLWVSRSGAWHTAWVQVPGLMDLLARVGQKYLGGMGHLAVALALLAALLVLAIGTFAVLRGVDELRLQARRVVASVRRQLQPTWPAALAFACWAIVPFVVAWAASEQGAANIFTGRYLVYIAPALCLAFGLALMALPSRAAQALVLVCVLGTTALTLPQYYAHAQTEDWRTPTRWLEQRYEPGDGLVAYDNAQGCELSIEAYLQSDGSAAHFTADSPGVMSWEGMRNGNPFPNNDAALDETALARFAAAHPRIFFIAGRLSSAADVARVQSVDQWLDAHYHFVDQVSSNVVTVRLYSTAAASTMAAHS